MQHITMGINQSDHKKNIPYIHFSISLFFLLSSIRLIFYQNTTILLPEDIFLFPVTIMIIYSISPSIGVLISHKKNSYYNILLYLLLGLYLVLGFIPTGYVKLLLAWIYSLGSWIYFAYYIKVDFSKLSSEKRYKGIIFAIMIDLLSRFPSIGTDPTIYPYLSVLFPKILLSIFILFNSKRNNIEIQADKTHVVYNFPIFGMAILLLMRFSINPGLIQSHITPSLFNFIVIEIVLLLYYFIIITPLFIQFIKRYFVYLKFVSLIIITLIVLFNQSVSIYYMLLGPLSVPAFAIILSDISVINQIETKLKILMIVLYSFTFGFIALDFYGASNLVMLPILIVFWIVKIKNNSNFNVQYAGIKIKKHFSVVFLLFIISIPILFVFPVNTNSENNSFSIMSYNLQYGVDSKGDYNPVETANYIIATGVSVVGLMEVPRGSTLNGNGDLFLQMFRVLKKAGFKYYLIMNNPVEVFTNVILSKYPIIDSKELIFSQNVAYRKGAISTTIQINDKTISVVLTHLTHVYSGNANKTRVLQTQELLNFININYIDENNKVLLIGDFNVLPTNYVISLITQDLHDNWIYSDPGYTWPAPIPSQRIDYIFSYNINATNMIVDYNSLHSDHYPVIATFDL